MSVLAQERIIERFFQDKTGEYGGANDDNRTGMESERITGGGEVEDIVEAGGGCAYLKF